jgi:hypothetical protein
VHYYTRLGPHEGARTIGEHTRWAVDNLEGRWFMENGVEDGEQAVIDAALIGAAQKVEHYEIAAYGTLTAMLKAMGEQKAAELLAQTLQEEKQTDELLTQVAEREVNPAALGKAAANDPSGRSKGAA